MPDMIIFISAVKRSCKDALRKITSLWRRGLLTALALMLIVIIAIVIGEKFQMTADRLTAGSTEPQSGSADLADVHASSFARGSTLVVGTTDPFSIIHPLYSTGEGENDAAALIFESLVLVDETGEPDGLLAVSWSYEPENHTLIFKLRDDHTFRDGRVLDASDVVYTYQCLLADSYDGPMQERFDLISSVSAGQSDSEVVFVLDSSVESPDFNLFTIGILKSDYYQTPLDRVYEMGINAHEPEGSGAYALVSLSETEAVLELRGGYGSTVRSIIIREVESSDKYTLLMNGELDIVRNNWDIRMQERADTLTAYNLTRFSTSVDSYFLVNPELRTSNIIQLPSQRLAVLLTAAGQQLSELQQSALAGLADRQLSLYYFAGLDDSIAEANRLKAERIANRLIAGGLAVQLEPLDWPELAARANIGDYDILLLPVTANNRLPEKTVILGDEVKPGASAFIAEYKHEVFIVSKRLMQLTVNPGGHPFASLAGSWTERLENVLVLNADGSIMEEESP